MEETHTMNTQNSKKKDRIIKCRCTENEYHCLLRIAQQKNRTLSDTMRESLFNTQTDCFSIVHKEILKQGMYNLILSTEMSNETKIKLIKEVEKL